MVDDEELVRVEACAFHAGVPVCAEWTALAGTSEENAEAPGTDEAAQTEGDGLELGGCEDAAVEADDGDLDGGAEDEICELVGQEDLLWLEFMQCHRRGYIYLPVVHHGLGV